jgi:hypothetical protein
MLGLGAARSLADLASLPRDVQTFRPQMPADQMQQLYGGWQTAVRRVL